MKREIQINVTIDTETKRITALNVTEGIYNNTEFVMDEVDDSVTIKEAVNFIKEELEYKAS